jgi:hypothetical protein
MWGKETIMRSLRQGILMSLVLPLIACFITIFLLTGCRGVALVDTEQKQAKRDESKQPEELGEPENRRIHTNKGEAGIALKPAAGVSAADLAPGLDFKSYEGEWDKLPDFGKLKEKKSGVTQDIDLSKRTRDDNFGIVFSGYLKIEKDGDYCLAAASDDGSSITLAGKQIVLNDGLHAMISVDSGPLALKAGFYPLEVKFFEWLYGEGLEVTLYDGKAGWKRIPRSMLFRKK